MHPSHLVKAKQKSHWMLSFSVRSIIKLKHLSSDLPILYLTYKTFSTLGILVLLLFNYCYRDNVLEALDIIYAHALQK